MYIKEITLDGFKSYAQQTVLSNFDPHFNAITGLNGSGKSNVLDSICFLLGISNLSQVRATNLQELIYKGGNAGITRATVSITFDNMDKSQSPPGYHEYEEITITRQIATGNKHKYLINGQNATAQRVSDLFCSVQLNVNNPNFLIMQGKITKVLNMKPVEILSMIEEAAGTKMYDVKKANALQTIEKKNAKLNEIERILREDITPQIERLKQERSAYIEYQKCDREYLHLHKFTVAHQFWETEHSVNKAKADTQEVENELEANTRRIDEILEANERLKREIKEFADSLTSKGKKGEINNKEADELEKLEQELKQLRIEIAKLNTQMNNLKSSVDSEAKREKEIEKSVKESKTLIGKKEKTLDEMKSKMEKVESDLKGAEEELSKAQKEYEALCCGFVIDEDSSQLQTLQDQLLNTRNKISDKKTQSKKAQLKLDNAVKESAKLKKELDNDTRVYVEKEEAFKKAKQAHDAMKAKLDALNYDPNKLDTLNMNKRTMNAEIRTMNDRIQEFYSRFPQLHLDYKDPEPNFDRSRVKGFVCNLFKVKDPMYATALETAAGSKLYNLVVDTDQTGKMLLQKGELKRKMTIIPMNQIRAYVLQDKQVRSAKQLVGGENVHRALDLIEYDARYQQVMEFVFGSRLVCATSDMGKKVAFHPQVMANTITLDGDHFDPEGTLSGGARGERAQLLVKMAEVHEQQATRQQRMNELGGLENELRAEGEAVQRFGQLKREFDALVNALNLARLNLEQTQEHQKRERIESLDKEIDELKNEIRLVVDDELKKLEAKLAELEEKAKNRDRNDTEKEKKTAQKRIEDAKKKLEAKQTSSRQFQEEYKSIKIEIEAMNNEINSYNEDLGKIKTSVGNLNNEIETLDKECNVKKEQEKKVLDAIGKLREVIMERNRIIDQKTKECDKLDKEKNSIELKNKELEHKKKNLSEQLTHLSEKLNHIAETHEWIREEKANFGKPNSGFDFQKHNMRETHHRLNELKSRKEKLCKQVDMRAMANLSKKEEEYEELTKRRQTVLKDRSTLESTIEDLEKVKTEVLIKAFESINRDLGNIFKTLLPGAFAKLEYVNRQSLLDGVEFKVAFGDVWKESLTELSGGQRSLVALSLILSLLLYKPAPLYILDEVDAALDTSHTQNIGLMIKRYFKHSQFIIVSLKDGMFTNANVLFKTKLVDGVSTVQRYEQAKKKTTNEARSNETTTPIAFNDQTNRSK